MNYNQTQIKVIRWPYLLSGIICMLFAGVIYAWSILKAPLAEEFGWNPAQMALNFTLTMCFFCIGGIISGILLKRTSPKVIVIISAFLVFLSFWGTSRINGSLSSLYISYGVLGGLGIGMAYNAVITATNAWFPDKRGTCSGALMMGFGSSTLILGNVAGFMLREEVAGWRSTYLILGVVIGAVLLVTGLFVGFPSGETPLPQPKTAGNRAEEETIGRLDYTTGEMIRRFTFWRFFLFSVTMTAVGNTVISFARDLALSVGSGAALATTLVGVLSVCNGLGRILAGILFDNLNRRKTMLLANCITISAPIVLLAAILNSSTPLCIAGLCLAGLSYGCSPPISSVFISAFYGSKNFAMNYSIANTMLIPTSFTATVAGSMVDTTGSYAAPVVLLLVLSIISLLLNLSIKRP